MARRRSDSKTGIVARLRKRGAERQELDPALDDQAIMVQFDIAKPTLRRWRRERGFPEPDFYIGLRGYTWARRVIAWTEQLPTTNPTVGRVGRAGTEAA